MAKNTLITVKTESLSDCRKAVQDLGDALATDYHSTKDQFAARNAIAAYANVVNIFKAEILQQEMMKRNQVEENKAKLRQRLLKDNVTEP
jgi:hypothetical protein